jgi:hypothetical protein
VEEAACRSAYILDYVEETAGRSPYILDYAL